ncbi:MAG TPA: hypothetical protein VMM78_09990 [Thermomicrobiales bacterium]|nr:hypothetical protein [Thermomicrobiales bacterium]
MLIARQTFQAKYGQGDALVALLKEFNTRMQEVGSAAPQLRIMTDASGPFFTVVTEVQVENFADWEGRFSRSMAQPWMGEWFGRMAQHIESGRRDFYTLVD